MDNHVEAMERKPSVYVVVAYRWGAVNNHNYVVTATADRDVAIAAAKEEHDGRGIKYGVEVVEYPEEERVAYFPSSAEPTDCMGPENSDHRDVAQYIGDEILAAFQSGVRSAASGRQMDTPGGPVDTLTHVPAEFPSWLAELCQHSLRIHRLE